MTMFALGITLLALVFIGIYAFMVWGIGWKAALGAFAFSAVVTTVVTVASYMISVGAA